MNQNERVFAIRKCVGLTMEEFGKRLGVTKVAISNIEKGKRNLTDQMSKSICREFGVNEEWLLDEHGEMFVVRSRKEQIAEFFADVETDPDDSIKVKIIDILSQLTVEDWEYLGELFNRIANRKEES